MTSITEKCFPGTLFPWYTHLVPKEMDTLNLQEIVACLGPNKTQ